MRIINVVSQRAGIIDNIESFLILEEQLSQEQTGKATDLFQKWCFKNSFTEEEETIESLIERGYWENSNYDSVSLVWSNINL